MHVTQSGLVNAIPECFEVFSAALELSGTSNDEIFGREYRVRRRKEVGGFVEVEREDRMYAVSGVVRGKSESAGRRDTFRPECGVKSTMPVVLVAVGDLVEGLSEVPMLAFGDAVGLRVVS